MADQPVSPATGDTTELLRAVHCLLDEETLAYLYTQLLKEDGWMGPQELVDASGLPEAIVNEGLSQLRETPLVTAKQDDRQRFFRANPFQIGVLRRGEITILTPTMLAAVGQRVVDKDVDAFVEDQGIDKLLRVVEYVKPYVDERMSERVASRELDLPPIVGTTIMVALEDVVTEMQNIDPYFEGIRDASREGPLPPEDGPIEVQYDEMTRIVIEPAADEDR